MGFPPEFHPVVLAAGKGSRMQEILSGKPKCLLPVGPKPLIWYPLYKLQLSGFTDCMVIVIEDQKSEIQTAVEKCGLSINVEYLPVPEDLGTADSLRLHHDKFISNVLIIPCDLVTDVNLVPAVKTFRRHNASIVSIFFQPQNYSDTVIPGPKSKNKQEKDIIGVDFQTKRLVFSASASDFESVLSLPKALLRKHTHIKIYSTLVDSHIYLLRNWVIKYLKTVENRSTLKGEFLPHVIRKQLSKPPKQPEVANPSLLISNQDEDIFSFAVEDKLDILAREMSSYNDHTGDSEPVYHGDSIRCYASIYDGDTFGVRVNTLSSYCLINKKIVEKWPKICRDEKLIPQSTDAEVKSTQVDNNCIIWEGAKLSEKTSFKNSIIGANVKVNSFSRVFNSILMKNVTIGEKVALENCIVAENTTIGSGSQLKSCIIGSDHTVPEQSHHTNEVLADSDRLMEF